MNSIGAWRLSIDSFTDGSIRNSRGDIDELVDEVLAGCGQDLPHATTLPAATYVSRAFFDLEVEKIFRREWLPVGHIAQIPNVGDYFTIDILNDPLVVVRGRDRIRVMSRVCLHRWVPVVSGAGNTKRFSCPFHRWAYDLDGQLVAAPLMEQAEGFDIRACKLPEIRSEIVNGTIFITFSATAPSIGETLTDLVETMAPYRPSELILGFSVEFELDFNWKIVVETFMEAYHHIGAHAKTLEPLYPAALHWVDDTRRGWTAGHGYLKPGLPTPTGNRSGLPEFAGLTEDQRRRSLCLLVYPTNTMFVSVDKITWTSVIPVTPDKTKWIRHILVLPEARDLPNFAELITDLRTRGLAVNQEDIAVNQLQQLGAASSFAHAGRLCHLEKPVWQVADYIRDRIRA